MKLLPFILVAFSITNPALGQSHKLRAPDDWRQEQIKLPPSFAPTMNLKGFEDIRFAPGMFAPKSDDFFSYVLVFDVQTGQTLDAKTLTSEFLTYYRGLAITVTKGKPDIDPGAFTLSLKESSSPQTESAATENKDVVRSYAGALSWTEPFKTLRQQKLQLYVDVAKSKDQKRDLIVVQASPAESKATIWKDLKKIRDQFFQP